MLYPDVLARFYEKLEHSCREAGIIPGKSGRHMKYPYTFSAKIAQFPIFHYLKHQWIWTYYPLGIFLASFAFIKIHNLVNSDANVQSWAKSQNKHSENDH